VDHPATPPRGSSFRSLALRIVLGFTAVAAASFAAYFAAVLDWLACENDTSEACDRANLAQLQLQVAVVGIAPVSAFAVACIGGWRRVAMAMVVLAAGTYLTWAVLADAAVHGWDDLKFFPF
jgi:hypothetical protein